MSSGYEKLRDAFEEVLEDRFEDVISEMQDGVLGEDLMENGLAALVDFICNTSESLRCSVDRRFPEMGEENESNMTQFLDVAQNSIFSLGILRQSFIGGDVGHIWDACNRVLKSIPDEYFYEPDGKTRIKEYLYLQKDKPDAMQAIRAFFLRKGYDKGTWPEDILDYHNGSSWMGRKKFRQKSYWVDGIA